MGPNLIGGVTQKWRLVKQKKTKISVESIAVIVQQRLYMNISASWLAAALDGKDLVLSNKE